MIVDKPNGGVSSARNAGLNIAKGDYIGFCDPDDYVSPIYIQTLVDTLEKNNADISACKYIRRKETTKYHKWSKQASKKEEVYNKKESIEMLMSGRLFNVCVWNKLYKREVVNNIRFDENVYYAEDVQFNYFAVKNVE